MRAWLANGSIQHHIGHSSPVLSPKNSLSCPQQIRPYARRQILPFKSLCYAINVITYLAVEQLFYKTMDVGLESGKLLVEFTGKL